MKAVQRGAVAIGVSTACVLTMTLGATASTPDDPAKLFGKTIDHLVAETGTSVGDQLETFTPSSQPEAEVSADEEPPTLPSNSPEEAEANQPYSVESTASSNVYYCKYTETSYAQGGNSGQGQYGVGSALGAFVSAAATRSGFTPGTTRASAWAAGGVSLDVSGVNSLRQMSHQADYRLNGVLEVDTEINALGPSDAEASFDYSFIAERNSAVVSNDSIVSETLDRGFPGTPRSKNVSEVGGVPSVTFNVRSWQSPVAYYAKADTSVEAESGLGTNAHASSDFFGPNTGTRLDYVGVFYTLDDGWVLTDCGNGTTPQ